MTSARHVDDAERRARLVTRHHLARTAPDVTAAVRGVAALHSSDPATPHLAAWARVPGFATADLDAALTESRALVRVHAMRRTLFVVPTDELGAFEAGATRDIAARERRQVEKWLAPELRGSVPRWLKNVEAQVVEHLADGVERGTRELSAAIPALATEVTLGSGKWAARAPIASRLLFVMAMDGRIVRTRSAGTWRASQYAWAHAERWLGEALDLSMDPAEGRARIARRYLATHGPVTTVDLRWWTGWTAKHAKAALADLEAVGVRLDGGGEGWLLPDDLAAVTAKPSVALLPGLDPTPMGWKERAFYLGPHAPPLFDTNGNVGPTAWVDGRVVGGWAQRPSGGVVVRTLEDVPKRRRAALEQEAKALGRWLGDAVVTPRFRTPLERELTT